MTSAKRNHGDRQRRRQRRRIVDFVGFKEQLMELRNRRLESLPMLAIDTGRWSLAAQMLLADTTLLHRQYDTAGRNALHHCALAAHGWRCLLAVAVGQLADHDAASQGALRRILAAVHMPDNQWLTPAQLAVRHDALEFVQLLSLVTREFGGDVDDLRLDAASAAACGAVRVSRWLRVRRRLGQQYRCEMLLGDAQAAAASSRLISAKLTTAFALLVSPRCPRQLLPSLELLRVARDPVSAALDIVADESAVVAALQQLRILPKPEM